MTVTGCSPQFYLYDGPTKPKPVVSGKEGGQQSGTIVISFTDRISFISNRASIQIYKMSFSYFSYSYKKKASYSWQLFWQLGFGGLKILIS